jgi:DNA-3-methyladenine glycosylase
MTEYLGKKYVPVEQDFFAAPSFEVAPRLIGCVLHHENRGEHVAIMLVETEAYDKSEKAIHLGSAQLLPHGHVYVHRYRNMWAIDLVCDLQEHGSSVLLRAAVPVLGEDIMIKRRSADANADGVIRERKPGFERRLCRGPCNLGGALGIYPALVGASLFKPPFRILRPVEPVRTLLNGPRANITKDAHLPWRWGHAEYQEWLSQPSYPKKETK